MLPATRERNKRPFVLELAASAFAASGWLDRFSFTTEELANQPIATEELIAKHGRDADAFAPEWCAWPLDETHAPLPLMLWGVLWPRDPRELVTPRGVALAKAVIAARDGIAAPPRWSAPGEALALRVLATVRSFERLLRSEAEAEAEAKAQRRTKEE